MNNNLLRKYIKVVVAESNQYISPKKDYTFKELYFFYKYLQDKNNAKSVVSFAFKIAGKTFVEDALSIMAKKVGTSVNNLSNETIGEVIEKVFKEKLNINMSDTFNETISKLYGINDYVGLKGITIPDGASNMIDDKIEFEFIKGHLLDRLEYQANQNPDKIVPINYVWEELQNYTQWINKKTKGFFPDKDWK